MTREGIEKIVSKYVPGNTVSACANWIIEHRIKVKVKNSRSTIAADYYSPFGNNGHVITINHDLNPYAFFIIFVHEIAHLKVWLKYRDGIEPHGVEWKLEYKNLMVPFLNEDIFPKDILFDLKKHLLKGASACCYDENLTRSLRKHDHDYDEWILLADLLGTITFKTKSGKKFKVEKRLRKNFKCINLENNDVYIVPPITEVKPLYSENTNQLLTLFDDSYTGN